MTRTSRAGRKAYAETSTAGNSRVLAGLFSCPFAVLLVLFACAFAIQNCGRETRLEQVAPPPDFDRLDPSVKSQFEDRYRALNDPEPTSSRSDELLGAKWGALGQWFHAYSYPTSASSCYRNAWILDHRNPRWPYYLAQLAMGAGEWETAASYFEAAALLEPPAEAPRIALGDLASDREDLENAAIHYRHVLDQNPSSPGALYGMGRMFLSQGKPEAALPFLETLAEIQPMASQLHYMLGTAWVQLGDAARADEHFQKVPSENTLQIPLRKNDPWTDEVTFLNSGTKELTRRSVRAFRDGDFGKAAFLVGRAVSNNPENVELRVNYAVALQKLGRKVAAMEQLYQVLELDPNNARANLVLGTYLSEEKRWAAAESHLRKAVEIDPRSPQAHLHLGKLQQTRGRLLDAVNEYAQVRELDRGMVGPRFWHAALLIALDQPQKARAALEEDLAVLPNEKPLHLLRIRLWSGPSESGRRDAAQTQALLGQWAGEPDVFFAETAAMAAAAAGNFRLAMAWQQAALEALTKSRARNAAHIARRRLLLYQGGETCSKVWESTETMISRPVQAPGERP